MSSDKPEDIIRLVEKYPEFKECYRDIREFRKKPEELVGMISKALRETDKSTERYMVREMQKEIEEQAKAIEEKDKTIEGKDKAIEEKDKAIEEKDKALQEQAKELEKQAKENLALQEEIKRLKASIN